MALRVELRFHGDDTLGALFEVRRTDFTDALSELFELTIEAFSTASDLEPAKLLGLRVSAHFLDEPLLPTITGLVRHARRDTAESSGVTRYRLHVVPPEWLLTRARRTRIFQASSVPAIVRAVRAGHGALQEPPAERLAPCPAREYSVQYDESDHEYVMRLLAEEGITTFHEHATGTWTLAHDTCSAALDTGPALPFNPANLTPSGAAVLRWSEIASCETSSVVRRDFDFSKPGLVLEARQSAKPGHAAEASLEDYAYDVGSFASEADGASLAAKRLEAHRATSRKLVLGTNFAAGAGSRLDISGPDIAGSWLVVSAHAIADAHAGSPSFSHELTVIPLDVPYRPRPRPKPRVHGIETAFVVGDTPPGTVDTDPYGRAKIEFRWDRRDLGKGNPTRWVRVAQAWAGSGYGLVTLPRVGDEVLVAYSQGDPDQPLVIGRVHNAVSVTPLTLPEPDKTKAMWRSQSFGPNGPVEGRNLISMDDKAGEELLEIQAQLDQYNGVGRDSTTAIGRHRAAFVRGDDLGEILGRQDIRVAGSSQTAVKGAMGATSGSVDIDSKSTMKLHSKGDMTLSSDADRTDQTSSNHFIHAGSVYVKAGDVVQVNAEHFHVFARSSIKLVCGGSAIVIESGKIDVVSTGPVNINGGVVKLNCE